MRKSTSSLTHDIFTAFDNSLEVRGVFWGILKAFTKVWDDGLVCKLKQNSIKDKGPISSDVPFEKSLTKNSFKWSVCIMYINAR